MYHLAFFMLLAGLIAHSRTSPLMIPNFRDLTIKIRHKFGDGPNTEMTWYFKGARQRVEQTQESSPHPTIVTLTQCDQKSEFILHEEKKNYLRTPIDEALSSDRYEVENRSADAVDVIITSDAFDTGERRPVGSYQARHVKTTITTEPSEEAGVRGSKMEIDGWYIDLPGWNCRADSGQRHGMMMGYVGERMPHFVFREVGTARLGFAIQETIKSTEAGVTKVSKTEFLEISEAPLDPALFEVPPGYTRVSRFEHPSR
jgi:hypothetical protein